MEVLLAEFLGFCYGVKRAIKIARENASTENNPSATLGPIIHNPQMVARLKDDGVGTINSLEEMESGTVIIRSHGVGPGIYEAAKAKNLKLVDATCPHVRRAQLAAKALVDEGYSVVIAGEKNHPEVKSIFEWTNGKATIVETVGEAETVTPSPKLGIVSQTTFSGENFKKIVLALIDKSQEVKIERTICNATSERQKAAAELAEKVDLMLVIGGKNSANTTRLYQLCKEKCKTYHIETAEELQDQWFDKIKKIGITAGASTPDWIIKEVYVKCQKK
ncbi:MAG: 4-hydroxy-3-methylbut-2-enyl diphosphate reductase [Selenomonadaceae bacterium]|nr:4-hydroxy-3-methylbut-2-enyl diphosphate reductase [Selenomonadaceae bacterium]